MPRSTLKLPKKPANSIAAGDTRTPARKPIRGGSQKAKHVTPRPADGKWKAPAAAASTANDRANSPARPPARAAGAARRQPVKARAEVAVMHKDSEAVIRSPSPEPRGTRSEMDARKGQNQAPDRFKERKADPVPTAERPARRSGSHPARGIARSTGARALPPMSQRPDRGTSPSAGVASSLPVAPAASPAPLPPAVTPPAAAAPQRGLAKESPRLSKLVSELAMCSRREADEWIENGWVSVDGVIINRLGARISPKATIRIKEVAGKHRTESVTILFNKPCGHPEVPPEDACDSPVALIRAENRWPEDGNSSRFQATHLRGLALAGRLEAGEGGLLVFTQEGSVARRLTGGDSRPENEYHVRVEGELMADGLELLRHGLTLDKVKLLRAEVSWLHEGQLRIVLHENRKRQIQGMCELVGLRATDIKRVRIGSVSLGKLAPGQWRYLRADERF